MNRCFHLLKSWGLSSLLLGSVAFSSQTDLKDEEAGANLLPQVKVETSDYFVEKSSQRLQVISSLKTLWNNYDLFIVDIMGVVHNGEQAFQPAVVALNKLFDDPTKKLIFISNTQRLGTSSKQTLIKFGIHPEVTVFTSGDAVRQDLSQKFSSKKIYHFGDTLNSHLTQGLNVIITNDLDEADLVMVSHYSDSQSPLDQFDPLLKEIAQRSLPILCVNPDKTAPRGPHDFFYCSGTFADKIEQWGGHVEYYGKPNVKIYQVIDD